MAGQGPFSASFASAGPALAAQQEITVALPPERSDHRAPWHAPRTPPRVPSPSIPTATLRGGGLPVAAAAAAVVAGGNWLSTRSADSAFHAGRDALVDSMVPGLSNNFRDLREGVFLDRAFSAFNTSTGTLATAGWAAATASSPLALTGGGAVIPALSSMTASVATVANLAGNLVRDVTTSAGLTHGGLLHDFFGLADPYARALEGAGNRPFEAWTPTPEELSASAARLVDGLAPPPADPEDFHGFVSLDDPHNCSRSPSGIMTLRSLNFFPQTDTAPHHGARRRFHGRQAFLPSRSVPAVPVPMAPAPPLQRAGTFPP